MLQAELAQRSLPGKPPILGRLHRGARRLEVVLGCARLLAGFYQASLQALLLRGRLAVRVTCLAPLLPHNASPQQLEARRGLGGLTRGGRLGTERLEARSELLSQVFQATQVGRELLQLLDRLLAPLLDAAHLGRLLEQLPALAGRADDDVLDVVLVDDRVRVDGQTCRGEHVDQVAAADACAVEEEVALAVAFHSSLDRDFLVVDRQPAGAVVEDHRDLGEGGSGASLAARVDNLLHLLAAEVARLAGAKDPFNGVDDVRLARTVWADDGGHSAVELDLGLPGKRFEAQQLQGL